MIIGNPNAFAIESSITQAYARPGWLGLGFFVLHIGGRQYGVREPDATMLGVPFDTVEERLVNHGTHRATFASFPDGAALFDTLSASLYADLEDETATAARSCCGMSPARLSELICETRLRWPDPDEAFDDGTSLFHFDVGSRVRLLVTNGGDPTSWRHNPETFRDLWLDAGYFYQVLQQWRIAFLNEWNRAHKIAEADDGAERAL